MHFLSQSWSPKLRTNFEGNFYYLVSDVLMQSVISVGAINLEPLKTGGMIGRTESLH